MKVVARSAAVRGVAAGLQLIFAVLVARRLPGHDAGSFFAYFGISMLWAVGARLGLEGLITREIASERPAIRAARAASCRNLGYATVSLMSATALSLLVALFVTSELDPTQALRAVLSLCTGSILALSVIDAEVLRGVGAAEKYQTVRAGALYGFGIPALIIGAEIGGLNGALVSMVVASSLTFVAGRWLVFTEGIGAAPDHAVWVLGRRLLSEGLAQLAATLVDQALVWGTPAFLLLSLPAEEVASISVSMRLALVVALPLLVVNGVFSPRLASSWAERSLDGFKRTFGQAVGSSTIMSLPIALVCFVVPELPLSLFGEEYGGATNIVRILAGAQFVSVLFGPVGEVLVMSGNVRSNLFASSASVLVGFVLLLVLPGSFGAEGAAVAIASAVVVRNVVSAIAGQQNAWRPLAATA